jgi:hypothetical protein
MIYGTKKALGSHLGTDRAEGNFKIYLDDTLVVSYPRSGKCAWDPSILGMR